MNSRLTAYLATLAVALGVVVWFTVPASAPKVLILVVVELSFVLVAGYQNWMLNQRRRRRHSGD